MKGALVGIDLIDWVIDAANSTGEDFNDGVVRPGWLTAEWEDGGILFVTYENPDNEVTTARYKIERIDG